MDQHNTDGTSRRKFMKLLGMLGIGGQHWLRPQNLMAAVNEAASSSRSGPAWPEMTYRKLGRTGYRASRLIFGEHDRHSSAIIEGSQNFAAALKESGYRVETAFDGADRSAREWLSVLSPGVVNTPGKLLRAPGGEP